MLGVEVSEAVDVPDDATVRVVPAGAWLAFEVPGRVPNADVASTRVEIIEWFAINDRLVRFRTQFQR